MATTHHAEHVGSLLRPPELLEARAAHAAGRIAMEQLREAEDRAALAAIAVQREAGVEVYTDGEVRRATWMAGLLESLGGVEPVNGNSPSVTWTRDRGPAPTDEETRFDRVVATGRVTRRVALTSVEAEFLAQHAPGPYKITLMSAAMGGVLWRPGLSEGTYPTPRALIEDLVDLQAAEINGLIDRGVRWVQLDSLSYNQVMDDRFRTRIPDAPAAAAVLNQSIAAERRLLAAVRAHEPSVTIGMHICRGNNRSAWMAQGGYEPIAERLFGELDIDRFLLEYDTERAGGFEPLRFVPRGRTVVLGLVSSKFPQLESKDELRRRVDEASRYVAMEDLAISPQCGFASTARGNLLTVDDERRKLELVAETARLIWS
ncbi:MAG TPA: cobalamin-independent methionine synthase II family protein [Candidatus Dormibacteraeota bacterium]|nr:cobalamin-independent methionine synthase II family protein [Candidatus Dormibacteraeota bacterium]